MSDGAPRRRYVHEGYVGAGVLAAALAVVYYLAVLDVIDVPHHYRFPILLAASILVFVNTRLRTGRWWPDVRQSRTGE